MIKLLIKTPLGLQETTDRSESTQRYRPKPKMEESAASLKGQISLADCQVPPPGVCGCPEQGVYPHRREVSLMKTWGKIFAVYLESALQKPFSKLHFLT